MRITSIREFLASLRRGKYTSVGSYPVFWLASDGGTLSYEACRENVWQIARAIRGNDNGGWRVVATDVNWEDASMLCEHTGERIESAYAEDSVRPIPSGTAVKVKEHRSKTGKGLSYDATEGTLIDACETDGWDVIDIRLPDGSEVSVYSFSVEGRL